MPSKPVSHPIPSQMPQGFQLLTGEMLPVFPSGCTVDPGHNDTLAACCAAVGGTPTQVDGVFGCPYTAAFVPAANQSFGACALEHGASSSCAPGAADRTSHNGGAITLKTLRWNGVVLLAAVVLSLLSS